MSKNTNVYFFKIPSLTYHAFEATNSSAIPGHTTREPPKSFFFICSCKASAAVTITGIPEL